MCTLGPKKDGSPNIEFFNSAESLQGFETIRLWLQKNCKKVCIVNNKSNNRWMLVLADDNRRWTSIINKNGVFPNKHDL